MIENLVCVKGNEKWKNVCVGNFLISLYKINWELREILILLYDDWER